LAPPEGVAKPAEAPKGPRRPKSGDFNAGGQVRLPSGPDEDGEYATFNWIALDLKARYYLFETVYLDAVAPLALIKPDQLMDMREPSTIGGITLKLDARLPKMPKLPGLKYETEVGVLLAAAYMREGALLLSDKDYPMFQGDFKPGFVVGPIMKVKLSSLLDFSLTPVWMYQSGTMESIEAIQVPMAMILKLGEVVKVSADLGVYTGDDYSLSGDDFGRLTAGGSLTLKIGRIMVHVGAGVASLLTGPAYPTIGDSVYFDFDIKYVK
jgi:hypothetical protein